MYAGQETDEVEMFSVLDVLNNLFYGLSVCLKKNAVLTHMFPNPQPWYLFTLFSVRAKSSKQNK